PRRVRGGRAGRSVRGGRRDGGAGGPFALFLALFQDLDPAADVERDDGGSGVRDLAHHGGDLVRGAVVQEPAEQRGIGAPRQDDGYLRAWERRLPADQFGGGLGQAAIRR